MTRLRFPSLLDFYRHIKKPDSRIVSLFYIIFNSCFVYLYGISIFIFTLHISLPVRVLNRTFDPYQPTEVPKGSLAVTAFSSTVVLVKRVRGTGWHVFLPRRLFQVHE